MEKWAYKKHHRPSYKRTASEELLCFLIQSLIATFYFKSQCTDFFSLLSALNLVMVVARWRFLYNVGFFLFSVVDGISVAKNVCCWFSCVRSESMRMEIHIVIFMKREKLHFRVMSRHTETHAEPNWCHSVVDATKWIFISQFTDINRWREDKKREAENKKNWEKILLNYS